MKGDVRAGGIARDRTFPGTTQPQPQPLTRHHGLGGQDLRRAIRSVKEHRADWSAADPLSQVRHRRSDILRLMLEIS
ncbi:hypothetical protein [Rhodospirillaceae bacterium SYSU D60014]|uniref:hypothetical protein n=1 Tax=Virgifigura deserti TaxID=2268457 RepID=UPI000E67618A